MELKLKAGEGAGATEAPRGLLYHRYQIDDKGLVTFAKITPPTATKPAADRSRSLCISTEDYQDAGG